MEEKKTTILATLSILSKYTDENHILSQREIAEHLENEYNITIDRRTLYSNINMLISFGYDISQYAENGVGYYLRDRDFHPSEILLLCNAIHASNFIPSSDSNKLIKKLLSTQNKYTEQDFKNNVYVNNLKKKNNKEFFLNVELINEAINTNTVISFQYTTYNKNKEIVPRREEPYTLSPYSLVYQDGKTFLIGKSSHHPGLSHFRVDKIKKIQLDKEENYIRPLKKEDSYEYAKNKVYMYGGEEIHVLLRCSYTILDDILDRFGLDIPVKEHDALHFDTRVKASQQGMKYLALQYLDNMEVLEPESLRKEIKSTLTKALKYYK